MDKLATDFTKISEAALARLEREGHFPRFNVQVNDTLQSCLIVGCVASDWGDVLMRALETARHARDEMIGQTDDPCERALFLYLVAASLEFMAVGLDFDRQAGCWVDSRQQISPEGSGTEKR